MLPALVLLPLAKPTASGEARRGQPAVNSSHGQEGYAGSQAVLVAAQAAVRCSRHATPCADMYAVDALCRHDAHV